jgi:hypothetical protein
MSVVDAVDDPRADPAMWERDRLELVAMVPEQVRPLALFIDERERGLPFRDLAAPRHGKAAQTDAVVDERADAHRDGQRRDDAELQPRRGDDAEVCCAGEERENALDGKRHIEG